MVKKRHGRNRSVNTRVSLQLDEFIRRLGTCLSFQDATDGPVQPGSLLSGSISEWVCREPDQFAVAYLFDELLSKLRLGKSGEVTARAATKRFSEAEEMCRETNLRLRSISRFSTSEDADNSLLECARQKIESLLGPVDLDEVASGMSWGPGASTRIRRRNSAAAYKYSGRPESTIGNAILANAAIAAFPLWQESLEFQEGSGYCNIVVGNRVVTVPKNYKTDRIIAIEPDMNIYVQKGIGAVLRNRLRLVGQNLDDQERNRRLALKGSCDGSFATIDLSMASDTISYELVRQLLPADWFTILEQCRSPVGVFTFGDGQNERTVRYQKFSSMGNGYTFELESLIFWALGRAVIDLVQPKERHLSVYGDDIIISPECVDRLVELFDFVGFRTNQKKTFSSGPFRESCGGHYHSGYDVTPFYIREIPTRLTDLFLLHNNLFRWLSRQSWNGQVKWKDAYALLAWLRSHAPSGWRVPGIPDGYGDGAFIGFFDECRPVRARYGLEGFSCRVILESPKSLTKDYPFGAIIEAVRPVDRAQVHDCVFMSEGRQKQILSRDLRAKVVKILVPQFAGISPLALLASA